MATIVEYIEGIENSKLAIKNAIISKGVPVPNADKLSTYANKIINIPQESGSTTPVESDDGWTRPMDRPAVPIINENEIYMLFGVMPVGTMDFSATFTATGGFTVDWGDGIVETIASPSATNISHTYNYADITSIEPNNVGIKWVWITIKGAFTTILTDVYPPGRTNQYTIPVYEIYLNAPNVTTWTWSNTQKSRYLLLEIFDWTGVNKLTAVLSMFAYCHNLKIVKLSTVTVQNFNYFLYNCKVNSVLNIDVSNGLYFNYFLSNSGINCPLNLDTSKGLSFNYAFSGVDRMVFPIIVNLQSATTALTNGFIGGSCRGIPSVRLLNMGSIHNILDVSYNNMNETALIDLFNDLYDRSSTTAGTITITGVFGASKLTAQQRAIATSKNWTIVG